MKLSRELRTLREETVSGVDSIGTRLSRCRNDVLDNQITLSRRSGPDHLELISRTGMQGIYIGLAAHSNSLNSEFTGSTNHSYRNLTSVCDKQFLHLGVRLQDRDDVTRTDDVLAVDLE